MTREEALRQYRMHRDSAEYQTLMARYLLAVWHDCWLTAQEDLGRIEAVAWAKERGYL